MKLKNFLVSSGVFSAIIFLTFKWIGNGLVSDLIVSRVSLKMPYVTPMIPVMRLSVTLNDGKYYYHLNFSGFQSEFPNLQTYQCSVIFTPPLGLYDERDSPLIIMAIKSHPASGGRRTAIRQTWARKQELKGYKLRHLFLLGRTEVLGDREMVKLENDVYGDILQWDMSEGHHNLSLKERCFLEWMNHNIPEVDYIFKGDDDVFVNTELVIDLIKDFGSPGIIHGFFQYRPIVMRYAKYKITETLYPLKRYPGFVSGGGFIFSGSSVPGLYEASRIMPVFPLDDVYFGFLALAANLTYRHDPRFHVWGLKYDVCKYKEALIVHGITQDQLINIWKEVNENKCEKKNNTKVNGG